MDNIIIEISIRDISKGKTLEVKPSSSFAGAKNILLELKEKYDTN